MKRKHVIGCLILLLLISFSQPLHLVYASSEGSSSSSTGTTATESSGGGGFSIVPQWVTDLMSKFDTIIDNFNKLMSGELVANMIDKLMAGWGDQIATPLYGTIAKVFLFTPEVANIPIIHKGWSAVMWIGLAIMSVSVLILALKVFFARQSMGKMLVLFAGSTVFIFYSLTLLHFLNVFVNYATQKALESVLGQTGIGYQGVTGADILKAMIIGKDVFTNPDYQSMTLGDLLVQTGGIFTLTGFIGNVVVPYFFLAIIKCLVLFAITVLINVWVVHVAFTGKYENLLGILNLYVRTLVVGLICSLSWACFVRVQEEYSASGGFSGDLVGIAPVYFAQGVVIAELIFFFFFWLKPLFGAIKDPINLNSGQVIKSFGDRMHKMSMVANVAGKRLGLEGMQRKSLDFADRSRKISKFGQDLKQLNATSGALRLASGLTGGLSEVIQGVKYERPNLNLRTGGSIVSNVPPSTQLGAAKISAGHMPHMPSVLKGQGYTESMRTKVAETNYDAMHDWLKEQDEAVQSRVQWDEETGTLMLPTGEEGADLYEQLQNENIQLGDLREGFGKEGMFVDATTGTLHRDGSKEARVHHQAINDMFPTMRKVDMSVHDAKSVARKLEGMKGEHSWISKIQVDQEGLWIPQDTAVAAMPIINKLSTKQQQKQRMEAPADSAFLGDMLQHLEASGNHGAMLSSIEYKPGESHLYVGDEHVMHFQRAYSQYTKEREPYWRDKHDEVWVIRDHEAIPWGNPPENGIDMGSFEKLRRDMHVKHSEQQYGSVSESSKSKRRRSKTQQTSTTTAPARSQASSAPAEPTRKASPEPKAAPQRAVSGSDVTIAPPGSTGQGGDTHE